MHVNQIRSIEQAPQPRQQEKVSPSSTSADRAGASASREASVGGSDETALTSAEKEYFATAFPAAAGDVRQHTLYQKDGTRLPLTVGTVVDRKG